MPNKRFLFIPTISRFWLLACAFGIPIAKSQECRAVSDCTSGRCISTVVCDRGQNSTSQLSTPHPYAPVKLPDQFTATMQASTPDANGITTISVNLRGSSRLVEINLNNAPVEVNLQPDLSFKLTRATSVGTNQFVLTAIDEFGRITSTSVAVYRAPTAVGEVQKLKRVAMVVGNANYKEKPLANSLNDANDMSKLLKEAGFDVIDIRDASLSHLRGSLRDWGDRIKTADAGLFYYAGHATEVRGRNYLIPIGANIKREDEIPDQSLDLGAVLEKIDTAKKATVVVLDACRDNPFARSFRTAAAGLAKVDSPSGTLISFATSPGRVAADGDGRNSPFTKHLIQELRQRNTPIEQVLKNVRRKVQDETLGTQIPWESTSLSVDYVIFR
jgi:hypothetical protein